MVIETALNVFLTLEMLIAVVANVYVLISLYLTKQVKPFHIIRIQRLGYGKKIAA